MTKTRNSWALAMVALCAMAAAAQPSIEFAGCGLLVEGLEGCVIFRADPGEREFTLENYGPFRPGDRVFVQGTVVSICSIICPNPCIVKNTIEPCSTDFDACGRLIRGLEGCVLFQPDASAETYLLDNYGAFGPDDRVRVAGVRDPSCASFCFVTCIRNNVIERCEPRRLEGCGLLRQGFECLIFVADSGGLYQVQNPAPFAAGDRVFIRGEIDPDCVSFCFLPCIRGAVFSECTTNLETCGVIVSGFAGCTFLASDSGESYTLEFLGSFGVGDRVRVAGVLDPRPCDDTCPTPPPCLRNNSIERCDVRRFEGCGLLRQGFECLIFVADSGEFYQLQEVGPFRAGDRVFVRGEIDPDCVTFCFIPCLRDNTIAECTTNLEACGTIVSGFAGCVFLATEAGPAYTLEFFDGFGIGDRVQVAGVLDPRPCDDTCPTPPPCIRNNSIRRAVSCGRSIDTCGLLRRLPPCLVFFPDDNPSTSYLLSETGPFRAGDRVRVVGTVDPDCVSPCFVPCVAVERIGPCTTDTDLCGRLVESEPCGVLFLPSGGPTTAPFRLENYGGLAPPACVRVAGVSPPLIEICRGGGPIRFLENNSIHRGCRADMNCDCRVNFDDIDGFVVALIGEAGYLEAYPDCTWSNADTNDDGRVNFDDIESFVCCLVAGTCDDCR